MKSTATVADLRPSEKLIADRMQGKNGSLKRVKSPITATSYTVASLQTATNSFSQENLIGEGSLGRVYRGEFPNGKVNCCALICILDVNVPYQFVSVSLDKCGLRLLHSICVLPWSLQRQYSNT